MADSIDVIRLQSLEKNLTKGTLLLQDIDDELLVNTSAVQKAKIQRDLDHVSELIKRWKAEKDELSGRLQGQTLDIEVRNQLDRIEGKLNDLQTSVDSARKEIIGEVRLTREEVLKQYDQGQQEMLKAIFDRIDETQLEVLLEITDQIQGLKPGDVSADLKEIQEALEALKQEASVPPEVKEEIKKVTQEAENQDSTRAKLKLTLPLIPGILDVSTDSLNLADLRFNARLFGGEVSVTARQALEKLKAVWLRIKNRKSAPAPG